MLRVPAVLAATTCIALVLPAGFASAQTARSKAAAQAQASSGGGAYGAPDAVANPTLDAPKAKLLANGKAAAPVNAPLRVQRAIWAANRIIGKPYRYGGGHGRFRDTGYDCSGTISYALRGGRFVKTPLHSGAFMSWGEPGEGEWITVYTNPGHAFVVIAGLRLDTSAAGDPGGGKGPRWRPTLRDTGGFKARHPRGF